MRKYIVVLVGLVFNVFCFGQETPKVIPPSPEAATILQHSPINVSLYTGTPNISVPFYTISHGGVEVPISLSYSSDGIRVDNIASWAGLGWSLNAGGLVSRTINKLPDDSNIGYMNTTYTIDDLRSRDSRQGPLGSNISFGGPEDQPWQLDPVRGDGEIRDYEPDVFNFSFLNHSGQFYYNQEEGEFNQAPLSNLRIETIKNSGIIMGFIITDEAGIKYYFGQSKDGNRTARETLKDAVTKTITYNGTFASSGRPFSMEALDCFQTWMLMDVVIPTSDEMIKFYYHVEENVEAWLLSGQEFIRIDSGCQFDDLSLLKKEFDQPKLQTITFPTGKVTVGKESTSRLDLKNSFALESLTLFDKNNQFVKKIKLHTSYMESLQTNEPEIIDSNELGRGNYRLQLDSISIQDKDSITDGRYIFKYNPQKLPNRYSKSVDYFGYYNGRNNTSFLPKTLHHSLFSQTISGTANRSINPAFTQSSILEKIIYPTGGYDEFDWGNNVISSFTGDASTYRDNLKDENDFYFTNDASLQGISLQGSTYIKNLTIPVNVVGLIEFNLSMTGCSPPSNLSHEDCHFELKIIGITDPSFSYTMTQTNFMLIPIELPQGEYVIKAKSRVPIVDPNQQTAGNSSFGLSIKWSHDLTPNEWLYDGLRIEKITTYDKADSIAYTKTYDYNYFNHLNHLSSGFTLNMVDVIFDPFFMCGDTAETVAVGFKLSSQNLAPSISTKGSLVGYKNVTESVTGGSLGRTEYTYSYMDEIVDPVLGSNDFYYNSSIPQNFRNKMYCDWLRGNIEKVEIFDNTNRRLSSKVYEYETANRKSIEYAGVQIVFFKNGSLGVCWNSALTEHHRLKKMIETNFFDTNEVTLTKEYSYNALSQLSKERTFDNAGLDVLTEYYYPSDASMSSKPFASTLVTQNRIGTPLVTKTKRNGKLLSTQETVYKDWDTTSGIFLLPELIQTSKGSATVEDRVKYNLIDTTNGNPLEVEKKGGMKTSYIWGYNKKQPVAKLENIAYASIPSALITAIQNATNSATGTEQDIIDALNALRTSTDANLQKAMITTLTYKPLIGVSTITDPKGQKTTYEYDSFGRLMNVYDNDGNILSNTQYNYRTQN